MRTLLAVMATLVFALTSALASDAKGMYIRGGGVGSLTCTQFLNTMATARQFGGLTSVDGATAINGYAMYVLGFQTAYNLLKPGIKDVFGSFGMSPSNDVLYAVEASCRDKPELPFGDALTVFADNLYKRIKK